jgi:hypothetical protein
LSFSDDVMIAHGKTTSVGTTSQKPEEKESRREKDTFEA